MSAILSVEGHDIHLTHLDKVLWPKDGFTKGNILEYYQSIAPYMLPHLKNRPLVMHRFPGGIDGESFFQKNIRKEDPPSWVKTVKVEHDEREVEYVLVQDEATLLYVVNLGSIELHTFHAQISDLQRPDYFVLDLDPNEIDFKYVIETALVIYEILEKAQVKCYCKTSGARGLHIYVPVAKHFDYGQIKTISESIAQMAHTMLPDTTTFEKRIVNKKNKVYLDYLRNSWAQTVVAPYSVRPKPHATVSTPLKWTEVKPGLDPQAFTIETIGKRLARIGDIFKPVLGKGSIRGLKKFLV